MTILWSSKMVKVTGIGTVILVPITLILLLVYTAIMLKSVGLPIWLGMSLLIVLSLFFIILLIGQLHEPFAVILDENNHLIFRCLFHTVALPPADLQSIKYTGVIIVAYTQGWFLFRGKQSRFRTLENWFMQENERIDNFTGMISGGMPTDEYIFKLLAQLRRMNPDIRIFSPYLARNIEKYAHNSPAGE